MALKSSQGFINKVGNVIKFALHKQDILDFEHQHCVADITDFNEHVPQIDPNTVAKWGGNSLVSDSTLNIATANPDGSKTVSPSFYTLNDLLPTISVGKIEGGEDELQDLYGDYKYPKLYRILYTHGSKVDQFLLYCDGEASDVLRQILLRPDGYWTRTNDREWSAWEKNSYAVQGNLDDLYSNVRRIIQDEVTTLNVALASKSNVGHTHPIEEFPSVVNWVDNRLDQASQSNREYVDSVEEKLQKEIDGTINSYFEKGIPSLDNYPASDWKIYDPDTHEEDEEATYAEYAKHEGDTYTNIQNFNKLDINNWEQGLVLATQEAINVESFDTCKLIASDSVRYKYLIEYNQGDTLQILKGNPDYMVYITYFNDYEILKGYSTYQVSQDTDQEIILSGESPKYNISIRSISEQEITPNIVPDLCLYVNPTAGQSWRFCKETDELEQTTWNWLQISDSSAIKALLLAQDAKNLANEKRRVFTPGSVLPSAPYEVGDLWTNATGEWSVDQDNKIAYNNVLLRCITPRSSKGTENISDWIPASRSIQTADNAVSILTNIASSDVITPQEKINIKKEWKEIEARYIEVRALAIQYTADSLVNIYLTGLTEAYNELKEYLVGITPNNNSDSIGVIGKNGSIDSDIMNENTENSEITDSLSTLFKNYYKSELRVLNSVSSVIDLKKIGGENLVETIGRFYQYEKGYNLPSYIPLNRSTFEKGKYVFSANITAANNNIPIHNLFASIVDSTTDATFEYDLVDGECKFSLIDDSPLYLKIHWDDLSGAIVTIKDAMIQKGERRTEYHPYVKHISDSLHTIVDIPGVVLDSPLEIRNANGDVSAGISGVYGTSRVPEDVLLWGNGTYNNAVNAAKTDYYKSDHSGDQITTLLKKDGTGKIGCARIIDNDTISVVTNSGTICITDNTIDSVLNSQVSQTGQLTANTISAISDDYDDFNFSDVAIAETNFNITNGGSYSISVPSMTITASAVARSAYLPEGEEIGAAYALASGRFGMRILNNGRIIYTGELSSQFAAELEDTTGNDEEITQSVVGTTPQVSKILALSPGSVSVQLFGSYRVTAKANFDPETGNGGKSNSSLTFSTVNISITGTDKYCVLAKDGIGVVANANAQFQIKNSNSGLQIIATGLPTSDSGLDTGQLWVNTITYIDDQNNTQTAKVLCIK